jgi:hypothetical protein
VNGGAGTVAAVAVATAAVDALINTLPTAAIIAEANIFNLRRLSYSAALKQLG